jgi:ketosteroid isomerase-like protein
MTADPRTVVEQWYGSLAALDMAGFAATLHEDVITNVAGRTAVSGRWHGKAELMHVVLPRVVRNLQPGTINLAHRHRIMAVDGPIVVGLMEGHATTTSGDLYQQQYCQIFRVEAGLIVEIWEFFDTVQAEARLFGKPIDPGPPLPQPLEF